ncbi:hypothetical protein H477_0678 [[Clostridium] sordellii ATCC 9714]|nr:hypothetical protein H477_0678 [[Clostridium] sordellii ATCC 9714] [Paeniclostridium sordellii ATCC 9714]
MYLKKVTIITCIILSIYIVFDINRYEERSITREDVRVDENRFQFIKKLRKKLKKVIKSMEFCHQ